MQLKVMALNDSEYAKLTTQPEDTGYDLYATEGVVIAPGDAKAVKHGIAIEPPPGFASSIRPRSSARIKAGLHVVTGTIDAGYRGELMSVVENRGPHLIEITPGQRVSQLVVEQVFKPEIVVTKTLTDTARGACGFGSTGT